MGSMSNMWSIMFIIAFLTLVSDMSYRLGITGDENNLTSPNPSGEGGGSPIGEPDQPESITEGSDGSWLPGSETFEAIGAAISWTFNTVSSFFQLITFQANGMPPIVNAVLFIPMAFAVVYLVIVVVRGGAN